MADFIVVPESDHLADPDDMTNAVFAFGVQSPAQVTGLANGTTFVAREVLRSPASQPFTPASAGLAPTVNMTPNSGTISQGTLAGSTLATVTFGGGDGDVSLSGPNASMFEIVGTSLQLVANADTVGSFSVTVSITNATATDSETFSLTVEAAAPSISITNNPEGTITINGDGEAQITLTEPPEYAGTYDLTATQVANLATTPVNLVAPTLTGNDPGAVGDTYALEYPGLWAFDGTEPTATYQWQRDGVDIAGQTDETVYTATVPGAVRLVETYGNASQASAAATVGAASSFAVTGVENWSVDVNAPNYTRAIADLSAGEDFILTFSSISSSDYFSAATLDGVAGTLVTDGTNTAQADQSNSEYSQSWLFTGVTGTSGDLVMTGGASLSRRMSFELVAVKDYQVAVVAILNTGTDATGMITTDVLGGDVILATFGKAFTGGAVFDPVVGFTATQNVNQENRPTCTGGHDVAADETARVFSVTGDAGRRNVGLVIILRAA